MSMSSTIGNAQQHMYSAIGYPTQAEFQKAARVQSMT